MKLFCTISFFYIIVSFNSNIIFFQVKLFCTISFMRFSQYAPLLLDKTKMVSCASENSNPVKILIVIIYAIKIENFFLLTNLKTFEMID